MSETHKKTEHQLPYLRWISFFLLRNTILLRIFLVLEILWYYWLLRLNVIDLLNTNKQQFIIYDKDSCSKNKYLPKRNDNEENKKKKIRIIFSFLILWVRWVLVTHYSAKETKDFDRNRMNHVKYISQMYI